MNRTPIAILISDIHYNLQNLSLANASTSLALKKAESLGIPLVIAGDLHDTKANLRAECVNSMINVFKSAKTKVYILIGNHCLLNEKGTEHSLGFLNPYCQIIDTPQYNTDLGVYFIPYQSSTDDLLGILAKVPSNTLILAHQGVQTAFMGHYTQDKTSLPPETFKRFTVVSGHYHRHQTIKCGETGSFTYIGTPYTTSFAEANDGPKGFQILFDDRSLELVPTNLRKHVIIEKTIGTDQDISCPNINKDDLVWVKLKGTQSELAKIKKKDIAEQLGVSNFKLDLIPTESIKLDIKIESMTNAEIFDTIVDRIEETHEQKRYLKILWREITYSKTS